MEITNAMTNETSPTTQPQATQAELSASASEPAANEAKPAAKTASKPKPKRKSPTKRKPASKETKADSAPSKPSPKPKRAPKKASAASKGATLDDVAAGYIAQLENDGASTSTISGYTAELKRALKVLDGSTLAGDLTEDTVKKFMRSKHVTMKRDGTKRDHKTIDRSRRVLRLALTFAAERGIIETAPIPEKI